MNLNHSRNITFGDTGHFSKNIGISKRSLKTTRKWIKRRIKKRLEEMGKNKLTREEARKIRRQRMIDEGYIFSPKPLNQNLCVFTEK